MEKSIVYNLESPHSKPNRPTPFLHRAFLLLLSLSICTYTFYSLTFTLPWINNVSSSNIPQNAQQIIHKCQTINLTPSPSEDFYLRTESDRFVDGTPPTLIKNASIWTGDIDGFEVVLGDVLLDKGIIKRVGNVISSELSAFENLTTVDAEGAWVTPGIVDLHSHLGDYSIPVLSGASDGNSLKGLVQPWLRSLDGLNTHDDAYHASIAGGLTTAVVLPGSANAIGGQAFAIKLRPTKERSSSSMLLEPPFTFNGTGIEEIQPPRWRLLKQACGENPSRVYSGTRMDTIWAFRQGYETARKIKVKQDAYCEKALSGNWNNLGDFPEDLQWEALVDVLRGKVKIQNHCYEAVDLDGIVRLTNEFKFPIAAFHHAHETYLVPELLKKAYGHPPAVAIFATNARYKRESYRGSEFAPRILADNGLKVVMKSDHPVLNSRYLLHEAQQAHYFGLADNLALASVTSTPATVMGQEHRIGFIKEGYDADLVIWDSHPLSLGATPKQVYIDGIAQLKFPDKSYTKKKPDSAQHPPKTPNFDDEAVDAVAYDGLPPLEPKETVSNVVVFRNVGSVYVKEAGGVKEVFSTEAEGMAEGGVVVVEKGRVVCSARKSLGCSTRGYATPRIVDLEGGSLSPGLITYGSSLGLVHISGEPSTQDGQVPNILSPSSLNPSNTPTLLRAVDGLQFSTRDALIAYRSGVTVGVTPPSSEGFLAGLSTGFSTGAKHKLVKGAVRRDAVAVHVRVSMGSDVSVSVQIAALRRLLLGEGEGEVGIQMRKVVEGKLPLVITVENADIMASLIKLKTEVERSSGSPIQMTFAGATEAHILAKEIGEASIGVIVLPVRPFPTNWEQRRILPGPPLSEDNAIRLLRANNVTVGVGVQEEWIARNTRFDIAWAALEAGLPKAEAISLASTNLETLLGLESEESQELVVTKGGNILDFEAKVVGVVSPVGGVVDLF